MNDPKQLGKNPLLHSAMSNVAGAGFVPHLDDTKNALEIPESKFKLLLDRLSAVAVDAHEFNTFMAQQKRTFLAHMNREFERMDHSDLKARKKHLRRRGVRTFRVLVRDKPHSTGKSSSYTFEYRRYVIRYLESTESVSSHYVVKVLYTLEKRDGSARRPEQTFMIHCAANATALDGATGSAFSSSMYNLPDHEWADKIREVYVRPYRLLEDLASTTKEDLSKQRFLHQDGIVKSLTAFKLGMTDEQMESAIHVQTFGFRWLVSMKRTLTSMDAEKNGRQLLMLMLFVLYNSKDHFTTRAIGLGHSLNMELEINRRTDAQENFFGYATSHEEETFDHIYRMSDAEAAMRGRLTSMFKSAKDDPIVGIRMKLKDTRRASTYSLSFHIPSEQYMRMMYRHTDALDRYTQTEDEFGRVQDTWKEMAKYGVMIGVDAYSGYLRDRRNIRTLHDLLQLFINEYKQSIQAFCQRIIQAVYHEIDLEYWLSCTWLRGVENKLPELAEDDVPVWKYLYDNPHRSILDYMMLKRVINVPIDARGQYQPTRDNIKALLSVCQRWRDEYGYDPSYSLGNHMQVVRVWYAPDDPKRYYLAERRGLSIEDRVKRTRRLMTQGPGSMLPRLVSVPIKPLPKR